jgi:hypothetical protein
MQATGKGFFVFAGGLHAATAGRFIPGWRGPGIKSSSSSKRLMIFEFDWSDMVDVVRRALGYDSYVIGVPKLALLPEE